MNFPGQKHDEVGCRMLPYSTEEKHQTFVQVWTFPNRIFFELFLQMITIKVEDTNYYLVISNVKNCPNEQ